MKQQEFNLREVINEKLSGEVAEVATEASEDITTKILDMAEAENTEVTPDLAISFEEPDTLDEDPLGKVVPYEAVEIEPIVIDNISDKYGVLSQKVNTLMEELSVRALPINEVGILNQVSSLKEHDLYELDGVKYAMKQDLDKATIAAYRDEVYRKLSSGLPYKQSLFVEVNKDTHSFKTLVMTYTDWSVLCSLFANYNPKTILTPDHDFILSIG